ncbi:MAG: sulfur carrier protein ThiS [Bacteroidaceae bacterium]
MNIFINHTSVATQCSTLEELAQNQNLPQKGVAIAIDNKMIPRQQWSETPLHENMQITILKAFCGG